MPKVMIGDEWRSFDFDENMVAALLYQGYDVQPDDGIDAEQQRAHSLLVQEKLQKLWGNQNMRTKDSQWRQDAAVPSMREDDSFGKRLMAPGTINRGEGRLVQPNPTINYTMPKATLVKPKVFDL